MKELENVWKRTLKRHSFPMDEFHAKNMVDVPRYESLLMELAKTIEEQESVYSISQSIVVNDFLSLPENLRRWMTGGQQKPSGKWKLGGCPSKAYFVPFQTCLQFVTDYVPVGGKAHFFFGLYRTFSKYALDLYQRVEKLPPKRFAEWKGQDRLGNIACPLACNTAQLQAADLLVYLSYKRALECVDALSFQEVPVSEMLLCCIRNTCDKHHHQVFTEKDLIARWEKAHIMTVEDNEGEH
jgi:hypothetical protein